MRLTYILPIILISILSFSCGTGVILSTGLSHDQGTLTTDERKSDKGPGAFIDLGVKRITNSEDRRTDIVHGFGVNYQLHINGYAFHQEGERFFYDLFQAKAYWELEKMSSDYITTYLYGGLGVGKRRNYDERTLLLAPTIGMDINFFRKEFIFISPKASFIRDVSLLGNQWSFELGMGFYFK